VARVVNFPGRAARVLILAVACIESNCGAGPALLNQVPPSPTSDVTNMRPADPPPPGGVLGSTVRAFGIDLPGICLIHHRHKWVQNGVISGGPPAIPDTVFLGSDGRPQRMNSQQCAQENERSLAAEELAYQQTMAASQQAAEDERRRRSAALAQVVRAEEARGYNRISLKDLYLDGKSYAASGAKVAVRGFFKAGGRHDERLYSSYDDFMMHSFQSTEALYIGLLTENASRHLRESLLNCQAGCNVTILGHVDECLETRLLSGASNEVCLVAEDIDGSEN
jgi:hypothetical protein